MLRSRATLILHLWNRLRRTQLTQNRPFTNAVNTKNLACTMPPHVSNSGLHGDHPRQLLGRISSLLPWRWRVGSSKSSIRNYQTTRRHNVKGRNLDIRRHNKSWYRVHYCFHKSSAKNTMLRQTNYPTSTYAFKINVNIFYQCTCKISQEVSYLPVFNKILLLSAYPCVQHFLPISPFLKWLP